MIQINEIILKVDFEGESKIPFWNDDLKVKVILALLNSIDIKHYHEEHLTDQGFQEANEIIDATKLAFGIDS